MNNLGKTTISGLIWSFTEQAGNKIIHFVIGIILARLLSPEEFGLIGMITVFLVISQTIANGGFSQALIRKKYCTNLDYNTTFFTNFITSLLLYIIFYLCSELIAKFYNEDQLELIIKILFLTLIIDSFTFVQRTKIYKAVKFKIFAKINIISQVISGSVGILMAYYGYGVWSLVVRIILNRLIVSILLIYNNSWFPKLKFSKTSFNDLFSFGYKMLFSNLLERIYKRIYYLIIGKIYSASMLGFYTRSEQFKSLIAEQLTSTIQRVTLPVLSSIQDDQARLQNAFSKMINSSIFISSFLLIGLAVIAQPLILFFIGEKWEQSIEFLQILAFSGILYPASQLNLNILQVRGRSDIILKLQGIKKTIAIPIIIGSAMISIKMMLFALVLISLFNFIADSYYSKNMINLSTIKQFQSLLKNILILGLSSIVTLFLLEQIAYLHQGLRLLISGITYLTMNLIVFEIIKEPGYMQIKNIIIQHLRKNAK